MTDISWSSDFSSFSFCSKNVLVLLAKPNSGELCGPAIALIVFCQSLIVKPQSHCHVLRARFYYVFKT